MCCPALFHTFKHFNSKAAMAHYPIILKEAGELLAKSTSELLTGQGLWLILNLKHFNHYIHIPTINMPTIRKIWQVTDLKDVYLHISIIKHHCHFLYFVGNKNFILGGFCHLGWLQLLGFSLHLLNPYCSFPIARVFMLFYIWMISWYWLA